MKPSEWSKHAEDHHRAAVGDIAVVAVKHPDGPTTPARLMRVMGVDQHGWATSLQDVLSGETRKRTQRDSVQLARLLSFRIEEAAEVTAKCEDLDELRHSLLPMRDELYYLALDNETVYPDARRSTEDSTNG